MCAILHEYIGIHHALMRADYVRYIVSLYAGGSLDPRS